MQNRQSDHFVPPASHTKGKVFRFFIYLLSAVLGLCLGAGAYTWILLGKAHYSAIAIKDENTGALLNQGGFRDQNGMVNGIYEERANPIKRVAKKDSRVENILVFGLDSREPGKETDPSRSDAMIVLSLDSRHREVKLTSLMRDTQVDYDGTSDAGKLNAAYVYGGAGLMLNTINKTFNLDTQRFIKFDFWSAADFIDAAGGVHIEVTPEELQYVNASVREQCALKKVSPDAYLLNQSGEQTLSGMQAVAWARIRAIGNDFARTSRQRTVISAVLDSFAKQSLMRKLNTLTKALPCMTTNLTRGEMMRLGLLNLRSFSRIKQYRVPEDGLYETNEDNWNMIVDWSRQIPALHKFIYGEDAGQ